MDNVTVTVTVTVTVIEANSILKTARRAAISRIERSMMPGSRALAAAREEDTHVDHQVDLSDRAPFRGRTILVWRAFPSEGVSAQVVAQDDASPGELEELARLANILTADVVRQFDATRAARVAALTALAAAFEAIS